MPGVRDQQCREDADQGRFAGAVGSKDTDDFTTFDGNGHVIDGTHFALVVLLSPPTQQWARFLEYLGDSINDYSVLCGVDDHTLYELSISEVINSQGMLSFALEWFRGTLLRTYLLL